MSAVERELEAYEDMRHELTDIARSTGAIKLDDEDGETLITCSNAAAERHAYALATLRFRKGVWHCPIAEVRETLRSVLDEARWGDRYEERYQYTF